MKSLMKLIVTVGIVMLGLWAGATRAESTYGYDSAGVGTVTATARVGLQVTVPRLILLRVGSSTSTVDTATFAISASIPGVPTAAINGSDQNVDWDRAAPTFSSTPAGNVLAASAWTNVTGSNFTCAVSTISSPGAGPTAANFTVAVGGAGNLSHPANLSLCANTTGITAFSVRNANWTYTLDATNAASWVPGLYEYLVTYTATTN